eukprot:2733656-Pyramimonas_sp.AAC.1
MPIVWCIICSAPRSTAALYRPAPHGLAETSLRVRRRPRLGGRGHFSCAWPCHPRDRAVWPFPGLDIEHRRVCVIILIAPGRLDNAVAKFKETGIKNAQV